MSQPVEITLDRPRRFRLTPTDWRDAARRASIHMGMPISTTRLLVLVGEQDEMSLACTLWAGCRRDDTKLTPDKILEALDTRRAAGQDMEDVGEAILAELRAIGVLRRQADEPEADPNDQTALKPSST